MPKLENSPFSVKSSNELFLQRQKNVFDQLNHLQCNLQNNIEEMDTDEAPSPVRTNRSMMKQFRGKESIFKRPQDPVTKNYMKSIPDFKKNPHKWKKYSLADVEDMSETCNTKAAFSFLNEMKRRNSAQTDNKSSEEPKKIVFKKVTTSERDAVSDEDKMKPSFKSSKVVMPEYVVGQKVAKEKKNKNLKSGSSQELKLDHLFEEEDE